MHFEQSIYCAAIKAVFWQNFVDCKVLDIGSMNVNGTNRFLFTSCNYTGIDIAKGKNVNIVSKGHEYKSDELFDTIICTEVFEHDKYFRETILNAISLLKDGGLFLFTCATTGRPEHGTTRTETFSSPFTTDYYLNVTEEMIREIKGFNEVWKYSTFSVDEKHSDLRFVGIKKGKTEQLAPSYIVLISVILKWFYLRRITDYSNFFKKTFLFKWIDEYFGEWKTNSGFVSDISEEYYLKINYKGKQIRVKSEIDYLFFRKDDFITFRTKIGKWSKKEYKHKS